MYPTGSFGLGVHKSVNTFPGNDELSPHEEPTQALFPPFNSPDGTYSMIPQDPEQPSSTPTPLFLRTRVLPLLRHYRPSRSCTNIWNLNTQIAGNVQSLPCISHYGEWRTVNKKKSFNVPKVWIHNNQAFRITDNCAPSRCPPQLERLSQDGRAYLQKDGMGYPAIAVAALTSPFPNP